MGYCTNIHISNTHIYSTMHNAFFKRFKGSSRAFLFGYTHIYPLAKKCNHGEIWSKVDFTSVLLIIVFCFICFTPFTEFYTREKLSKSVLLFNAIPFYTLFVLFSAVLAA